MPGDRPEYKKAPNYTFGFKRGGTGALKNQTSTPNSVGPGRYAPELSANPSNKKDYPQWTLPKGGRPPADARKYDKNQTYDTRSSIGPQCHSKNKTSGFCHFGSATRDIAAKQGLFRGHMQSSAPVKLYHPTW